MILCFLGAYNEALYAVDASYAAIGNGDEPSPPHLHVINPELVVDDDILTATLHACDNVIARQGLVGWWYKVRGYKQTAEEIKVNLEPAQ